MEGVFSSKEENYLLKWFEYKIWLLNKPLININRDVEQYDDTVPINNRLKLINLKFIVESFSERIYAVKGETFWHVSLRV